MCSRHLRKTWLPLLCNSNMETVSRGAPDILAYMNETEEERSQESEPAKCYVTNSGAWVIPREEPMVSISYRAQGLHVSLGSDNQAPRLFTALGPWDMENLSPWKGSNTERKWEWDLLLCHWYRTIKEKGTVSVIKNNDVKLEEECLFFLSFLCCSLHVSKS